MPVISLRPVEPGQEPLVANPKPGDSLHRRCFLVGPRRSDSLSLSSKSHGSGARRFPLLRPGDSDNDDGRQVLELIGGRHDALELAAAVVVIGMGGRWPIAAPGKCCIE